MSTYKTQALVTQELYNTAMFDLANLVLSLAYGTGAYTGIRLVSAAIGDDQCLTIIVDNPIPESEMVQYSFSLIS